ncbi:14423_t:CDS:1, partial [Funneliformis geosporum]
DETEIKESNIIDDDWKVNDLEETNNQDEDSFKKEKELKNNNEMVKPIEKHEF